MPIPLRLTTAGNAPTGNAPTGNAPTGNAPTGNGPAGNGPAGGSPYGDDLRSPSRPQVAGDHAAAGWKDIAKRALQETKQDRVPMMAGSLAYHAFLALFPTIIALLGVSQLVGLGGPEMKSLVHGIGKTLPQGAAGVLTTAVTAAQHRTGGALTVTVVAVLIALWSASGGMANVEIGLDVAYEVPAERKFVAKRLVGLAMLAVLLVLGGIASALIVFGRPLGNAVGSGLSVDGPVFDGLWTAGRWVGAIFVVTMLFAVLYRVAPNRQAPTWRWFSPGGLVAAAIWLGASLALSFYVSALGSYAKTYGALAGVAVLLLWFYLSGLALLLGAEVNCEVERQAPPAT